MRNKLLLMTACIFVLLASSVLADDFIINNNTGDQILRAESDGDFNVTMRIAEHGIWLTDTYWAITDVATPSDGDTTHLSSADQIFDYIASLNYLDEELDPHLTAMSGDINLTISGFSNLTLADCEAGYLVIGVEANGSVKCALDDAGTLAESDLGWNGNFTRMKIDCNAAHKVVGIHENGSFKCAIDIDTLYTAGDGLDLSSEEFTFDCSDTVEADGNATCHDENLVVTGELWVDKAGDTMTGDLIMSAANVSLSGGAIASDAGKSKIEITADGVIITLE